MDCPDVFPITNLCFTSDWYTFNEVATVENSSTYLHHNLGHFGRLPIFTTTIVMSMDTN